MENIAPYSHLASRRWRFAIAFAALISTTIGHAVTVSDFEVTPVTASVLVGQHQAFNAMATFSDGSTRTLSSATLAGGSLHTCVVLLDGGVSCWGNNSFGQLGDTVDSNGADTAVVVTAVQSAVAISAGIHHNCALLADTSVRCWGAGGSGQLGDGAATQSTSPVVVGNSLSAVIALDAGGHHTCAVRSDGTVACWGANDIGQLGIGTDSGPEACGGNICSSVPVDVSGVDLAIGIAAGQDHTCVVLSDGSVQCWGSNSHGQLGIDPNLQDRSTVPAPVAGIETATAVAAGARHTCALLGNGTVRCWGNNFPDGELGDGTLINSFIPVPVAGVNAATAITAGSDHSCALLSDDTIHCWGDNTYGQLGNGGAPVDSAIPAAVSGIGGAVAVSAGTSHTCALLSDLTPVRCWGRGDGGQLGDGLASNSSEPVKVAGVGQPVAVTATDFNSCALHANGSLACWGDNSSGQLGDGIGADGSSTPVVLTDIEGATDMSAAGYSICVEGTDGDPNTRDVTCMAAGHACVVLADGDVGCWGANNKGQIGPLPPGSEVCSVGPVSTSCSTNPVAISGIADAADVDAGEAYTCAVLSGGAVHCWGANAFGQLGDGTRNDSFDPVAVSGITSATAVSAGKGHACALLSDGTVRCWGSNDRGRLGVSGEGLEDCGDGIVPHACSTSPVAVSGIDSAVAVSAGLAHTCALLSNGTIRCWGANNLGRLGDGTQTDSFTPVAVSGISSAVAVTAGGFHSCAVLSDGSILCWGRNHAGQIGISPDASDLCALGPHVCKTTPVAVNGIDNAVAVSAGAAHTCAISSDHSVRCWGTNLLGQLGDGSAQSDSFSPVHVPGLSMPTLFTWLSSVPSVAGINTNGIATGLGLGSATVTASLTVLSGGGGSTLALLRHADLTVLGSTQTLTLGLAGAGGGTVTSNPPGIECGTDCSEVYETFTEVRLTGTADAGSIFSGFSGHADCTDGNITMNAEITCTAAFDLEAAVNNAPAAFALISPLNGETGLPTEVTFVWNAASDADGDAVSYEFCLREDNANFVDRTDCATVAQSASLEHALMYTGLGSSAIGLLMFGIIVTGDTRRRKKTELLIALLIVASVSLLSCGGGAQNDGSTVSGQVRHTVSGLNPNTVYVWKVVAEDGQGGRTESETRNFNTQ